MYRICTVCSVPSGPVNSKYGIMVALAMYK